MTQKDMGDSDMAARLRGIRIKNGLSQKDFAASLGAVPSMVSEVDVGKRMPSRQVLAVLAGKYQVILNWFLLGIGENTLQSSTEKHEIESLRQKNEEFQKENQELKKTIENLDLEIQALNKELLVRFRQLVDNPGSKFIPGNA